MERRYTSQPGIRKTLYEEKSRVVTETIVLVASSRPAALKEIMLRQNQRDLGRARIFVKELAFVRGERHGIDLVMDDLSGRLGNLIEDAKARGEVAREIDPEIFAYNLFALYFAFLVLWLGGGAPSLERQHPSLRQIIELQLGVVSASAAKRSTGKRQE